MNLITFPKQSLKQGLGSVMMGVLSGGREWGGRIHLRKVLLTSMASAGDWLQLELGV